MAISFENAFGIHETAVLARARRAGVIADNLANADTPNYKARDMDFGAVLGEAVAGRDGAELRRTHQRHLTAAPAAPGAPEMAALRYRVPLNPSLDGNTVDVNTEQAAFAKNAMMYQASLHFLNRRATGMLNVIKGE